MSEANNNPATNCQQKGRAVAVDMGTTNRQSVLHSGLGWGAVHSGLGWGAVHCATLTRHSS